MFRHLTAPLITLAVLSPTAATAQSDAVKELRGQYIVQGEVNGHHKLIEKGRTKRQGLAAADGRIVIPVEQAYVSAATPCGTVLMGTPVRGPSDGGGGPIDRLTSPRLVDLSTGETRTAPPGDLKILTGTGYHEFLYAYTALSGKVGVYDLCEGAVTDAVYDHVTGFSKGGFAAVFAGEQYDVIDTSGQSMLPAKLVHGIDASAPSRAPLPRATSRFIVREGKLLASEDGKSFGLYDIAAGRMVVPAQFDLVNAAPAQGGPATGHVVTRAGKQSLYDTATGSLAMPFMFTEFGLFERGERLYAEGWLGDENGNSHVGRNLYDVAAGTMMLPDDLAIQNIRFLSEDLVQFTFGERGNEGFGLLRTSDAVMVIEPEAGNGAGLSTGKDGYFYAEKGEAKALISPQGERLTPFIDKADSFEALTSQGPNGPVMAYLARDTGRGGTTTLISQDGEVFWQAPRGNVFRVRAESFGFRAIEGTDRRSRKDSSTCFDHNFQPIGERFSCSL
jgi:hypothetical protein